MQSLFTQFKLTVEDHIAMLKTIMTFVISLFFIATPDLRAGEADTSVQVTLQSAIAKGSVRAMFAGTGSYSGDAVLLTLSANVAIDHEIQLNIPRGSILRSINPSE
jgi:hypothetical protein